jgi:hypothetical protein
MKVNGAHPAAVPFRWMRTLKAKKNVRIEGSGTK